MNKLLLASTISSILLSTSAVANVDYLTGGVGKSDANEMRALARNYDVAFIFSERSGSFFNDIHVTVKDNCGDTVLNVVSGPILLVNLPSGRYTVRAVVNDVSITKVVHVSHRGHKNVSFVWSNNVDSHLIRYGYSEPEYYCCVPRYYYSYVPQDNLTQSEEWEFWHNQ